MPAPLVCTQTHVDHALTEAHLAFIARRFPDVTGFLLETVEMPADLPDLPCALHGPATGGAPVVEDQVAYVRRGERAWASRVVVREPVPSRMLTVIAGFGEGELAGEIVLWTAFGGPSTPREVGDVALVTDADREASAAFWREHALGVAAL